MGLIYFIKDLIVKINEDEIFSRANEITYRLIISIFPFIIFLMTLVGFLNINTRDMIAQIDGLLPMEIMNLLHVFVEEVVETKNTKLLYISLSVLLLNASAGFVSVVKGLTLAYEIEDKRNPLFIRFMGFIFVPFFAIIIIGSILLLIYGDSLLSMLPSYWHENLLFLLGLSKYFIALLIVQVFIAIVYKIAIPISIPFSYHIPGSIVTAVVWVVSSKFFNIYVNNYSKYSMIYGSVASLFILMLWLNMISIILLLGNEINALIYKRVNEEPPCYEGHPEKLKFSDIKEIKNTQSESEKDG